MIHVANEASSQHKKSSLAVSSSDSGASRTENPESAATETGNAQPARRFHISRSMLRNEADPNGTQSGVSKRARKGPAIFVERTRKKITPKSPMDRRVVSSAATSFAQSQASGSEPPKREDGQTTKDLKRPGTTSRLRANKAAPARTPLPATMRRPHEEEMSKMTESMNEWVFNEIGANLHAIEQDRQQPQTTSPFRPKAPAQRFRDRHPEASVPSVTNAPDASGSAMDIDDAVEDDVSEEEAEGDWVYEEYVRIPNDGNVQKDLIPSDVGVLVLDGEEATALFYGPDNDSDDDFAEDDEDENGTSPSRVFCLAARKKKHIVDNLLTSNLAENHYTADYPEDEVDSEDEYGRQAYLYRTKNASDDEEFDNEGYESSDEMVLDGDNDDPDATMARIKAYMRRRAARE